MRATGIEENSRNGLVKTIPHPVTLTTLRPRNRVLFVPERKENPYFHFAECLWMMAGCDIAAWLEDFNPRMMDYAEETGEIHGAYGFRWREHFNSDQLLDVRAMLRRDPTTRRAVISMWDPNLDLGVEKKDLPCNTHIYFRAYQDNSLTMTVLNRSNDLVWGAVGSNIVHFSFLHELMASSLRMSVGPMYQVTNNLHIYKRHWLFLERPPEHQTYEELGVGAYPILQGDLGSWLRECEDLVFHNKRRGFQEPFFEEVAVPLLQRNSRLCKATDWRLACERYDERMKDEL
jgi:thymidylate synthase